MQANHCRRLGRVKKNDIVGQPRIRREGGGRHASQKRFFNIDEVFLLVVSAHTAGDPMNEKIKWTKLTRQQIGTEMKKRGVPVSRNIVGKLLKAHGFVKRKIQRKKATGEFQHRDKQFKAIEKTKSVFMLSNNPILSIDTKKKEKLGNLHRNGKVYCTQTLESFDHDYTQLSTGTIVPHGIYDIKRNEALITIGVSNETASFICDSVKGWWTKVGKKHYPTATEFLIYCDAGGANSYRHHVFKFALQKLANEINIPIRICHYPPYTSKWNPIEHKVFPHVTRAMEGVKLESLDDAKRLIKNTRTKAGLKVLVNTIRKIYQTGVRVTKEIMRQINIKTHGTLSQLNYTISPATLKC